ncbi:MAG: hypothetical protein HeimC3_13170 [Candidatus Heimdallarchaeota archaeon LC_3]|nr:MAG: hypothetical protein HeimC3_13170 [Candidatus Heimdallarchaeota archaeon LC_3]
MIIEVIILRNGLHAFHRIYSDISIENINITGGLFQAIYSFSQVYAEDELRSINMKQFIYHFKAHKGFIFILKQLSDPDFSTEVIRYLLDQLGLSFFKNYPDAEEWDGISKQKFDDFTLVCDEILDRRPLRRGVPFLFKVLLKPFLMLPISQVVSITSENQNLYNYIIYHFHRYSELLGYKNLVKLVENPFMLYLKIPQNLVYAYPFLNTTKKDNFVYLLCFVTENKNWFAFYQVNSLINKKVGYILPILEDYLKKIEKNPTIDSLQVQKPKIQELVNNWANLNQYVGALQANLFEEFIKYGTIKKTLTEEEVRSQLLIIFTKFPKDIDKLIFALLTQQKILFVSLEKEKLKSTINALLTFYPQPAVNLWAEKPSDGLIVGTDPKLVSEYDHKNILIVDMENDKIFGGEKNEYCENLLIDTTKLIRDLSVTEARRFFLGKISSIFNILTSLLEVSILEDNEKQFRVILKVCPKAVIHLITKMSKDIHPILSKRIDKFN